MDAVSGRPGSSTPPLVANLGVPVRHIPHGKPDDILASIGLDGPGIATSVGRLLAPEAAEALH